MDSDATLVITAGGRMEEGTRLTLEWAAEYGRPYLHLDLAGNDLPEGEALERVKAWLLSLEAQTLNVAGNRESTSPGIAGLTVRILEKLFGKEGHT
jgi:hypothetical protein